jgi:V8-like Glu-specific endopeptidase
MIKTRSRGNSASAFDDDSPFRPWSPAPEAGEYEWPHSAEQPEWFGATADTEMPELETDTKCTDSGVGIIGTDDRQPVTNTVDVPFRWICQLWIRRQDSNGKVTDTGATGVLVSPRHVLTAAHAIKEDKRDDRNQWVTYEATQIRVSPGRDGDDRPLGTYDVKFPAQIAPGWTSRDPRGSEHDYALLTLDTPAGDKTFKALGNQKLCYWGSAEYPQATAVRQDPNTLVRATGISAGYPNDRGGAVKLFTTSGQLGGVVSTRRFMNFAADACQGQSGSPVWIFAGGEYRLVGLLVRVQSGSALVIRITREFAKQLRDWMGSASEAFKQTESESESESESEEEEQIGEGDVEVGETSHEEERRVMSGPVEEQLDVEAQTPPPPVLLTRLAFLTTIAAPLDPGIYDGPVRYRATQPLQKCLEDAVKAVGTGSAPVALVDLTKDPSAPDFAGWNHKAPTFPASMAKLIPMLAAFQLRSDLTAVRTALGGAPTAAEVFAEARKRWVATQTPPSGAPVVAVSGDLGRQGDLVTWKGKPVALPANSSLPKLETIFGTAAGFPFRSTPLRFPGTTACSAEADEFVHLERVERFADGGDRQYGFLQRLKLMIGFSNNSAATSCIVDIGFPYIASVLIQTGLWDPARDGGLWLGQGYGGPAWRASLLGGGTVSATAGALAALLTLIARDLAVDPASSADMRALFKKDAYPGAYTRSGFKGGLDAELARLKRPRATVFSKLGLLSGPEYDCAIIERDEGTTHLKYVAVAMNVPGTAAIHKLIVALDQCIRTNNGL